MTDSVHPTIDELADLHEGLLDEADAQRFGEHLSSCTSCSADFQQLREVEALLTAAGAEPTGMPLDVVARIDDALAAEAAGEQPTVTSMAKARSEYVPPRKRRPWLQIMAGAAAVLVFAAFGIEGWQAMNTGGDDDSADSGSAADSGGNSALLEEDAPQDNGAGKAQGGDGFQNFQGRRTEVTPDSLPTFARQLDSKEGFAAAETQRVTDRCAAAASQGPTGSLPAQVRWADRVAVVLVDTEARTATVFGCGTGSPELYSTSY